MTDLVTDAAIDAATEKVNRTPLNEDPLVPALNAAAPHIAAEALRQAAEQLGKFEKESSRDGYVVSVSAAVSYLSGKADELEGE